MDEMKSEKLTLSYFVERVFPFYDPKYVSTKWMTAFREHITTDTAK